MSQYVNFSEYSTAIRKGFYDRMEHPGTPILHIERFTRGKGKFHVTEHLPPQEMPDDEYPMILTTGRVLYIGMGPR